MFSQFDAVWVVDTEFQTEPPGSRPRPVSLVARNLRTGEEIRQFRGEFGRCPPYPTNGKALIIAYYASAELGFHRALGWTLPENVLDLYIEFRNLTNGFYLPHGAGLVGACSYFGIDYPADKHKMVELINRDGWSATERSEIVHYNAVDVHAETRLTRCMYDMLNIERALYRGLFPAVAAEMEWGGLPIDGATLDSLRRHWLDIQDKLIARIGASYRACIKTNGKEELQSVYDGRTFKEAVFEAWLAEECIPWPRLSSGRLSLEDDTFRELERIYPVKIGALRELRHALSQLRLEDLSAGPDDRNRTLSSYFRARTSRSQPSNSKGLFGASVWTRGLLKPEPGTGLIVCDYSQQEFGIGAGLSHDPAMQRAYAAGDAYLGFAVEAGALPPEAMRRYLDRRKAGTPFDSDDRLTDKIREVYKPTTLAIQYGRGEHALARSLDKQPIEARRLIQQSHESFPVFWDWSDRRVHYALLNRHTSTVLGWRLHLPPDFIDEINGVVGIRSPNVRSLQNFPMQANGAEMTRLAARLAYDRGIPVRLTVHDSIIAEADLEMIEWAARVLAECMVEASRIILGGFALRVDTKIVRYPDRYMDKRGVRMWNEVMARSRKSRRRQHDGQTQDPARAAAARRQ